MPPQRVQSPLPLQALHFCFPPTPADACALVVSASANETAISTSHSRGAVTNWAQAYSTAVSPSVYITRRLRRFMSPPMPRTGTTYSRPCHAANMVGHV